MRLSRRSPVITFYYSLAPNPMKVALCLEETGLPYELKPVDTRKGEQHRPEFLALNPNGKVPVIVDQETGATVFDSNAILLYGQYRNQEPYGRDRRHRRSRSARTHPDLCRGDLGR